MPALPTALYAGACKGPMPAIVTWLRPLHLVLRWISKSSTHVASCVPLSCQVATHVMQPARQAVSVVYVPMTRTYWATSAAGHVTVIDPRGPARVSDFVRDTRRAALFDLCCPASQFARFAYFAWLQPDASRPSIPRVAQTCSCARCMLARCRIRVTQQCTRAAAWTYTRQWRCGSQQARMRCWAGRAAARWCCGATARPPRTAHLPQAPRGACDAMRFCALCAAQSLNAHLQ